jgi:hypothetical protein
LIDYYNKLLKPLVSSPSLISPGLKRASGAINLGEFTPIVCPSGSS